MREVLLQLTNELRGGREIVYCRLVETRGSTPQKAGAAMLIRPDGSQVGTLGGGCVEAEVKRRALAALQKRQPEIATFQLDNDYGWDDGLICGGRMQIAVVPIVDEPARQYLLQLAELIERGHGITEAIAFEAASSGIAVPACFLFDQEGQLVAAYRSAAAGAPDSVEPASAGPQDTAGPPDSVAENLRPLSDRPRPYVARGIGFLPTLPRCRLVIVGGGHVGQAVGQLAADLDFDVWVVDDRAEYVSAERFPRAEQRMSGPIEEVLPNLEITPDTYCLIVTRGHSHDEQALYYLADRGARYVGMIGSRRKIRMIFDDLLAQGVSSDALSRVYAPLGIDIGSQTVPEIAVSICAELVSHRNRGGTVPGRPDPVRITDLPAGSDSFA